MGKVWAVSVLFSFMVGTFVLEAAPPKFGRFSGVLRHSSIKRDQLAKLDFVASREEGNTLYLKAILTLHFGDFKSGEYVGIHFDEVRFDLTTQTFVFEQADQPVTLVAKKFTDTEFVGEFRSNYSGATGEIILGRGVPVALKYPLIDPVWGEYRGVCKSKFDGKPVQTLLQLYTYRTVGGSKRDGNPFRAYSVTGTIGEKSQKSCGRLPNNECVWGNISQASFNFFKNKLTIFTSHGNLSCSQSVTGISCNECPNLARISNEVAAPRTTVPVEHPSSFASTSGPTTTAVTGSLGALEGEYVGYVHHELTDTYQAGSINLLTYRASATPGEAASLRLSATATLYFGDENSSESLSYHFAERSYPNPLLAPQFVFSQADADVDAILQVTKLGNGIVSGVWFSRLFGRVGSFVFQKNGGVTIPATAKIMPPLSGDYISSLWELYLSVGLGSSEPGTQNPFSPLDFGGWVVPTDGVLRKADTVAGSYDFYRGRLFLQFENGKHFVGERDSRDRLRLAKTSHVTTSPMPRFDLEQYRLSH